MKRLAALLAFTSVLAACGGTVEETAPTRAAAPQSVLAAFDAPRPFERAGGIEAADGRSYYIVADGELQRFSTLTGKVTRTYDLDGDWELSGVSATGGWVALQRPGTEILVLDTKTGRTTHELELRGDFRVETISAAGDFLFLQQDFVDGSYAVRGYDLAANQMLPGSLGTKGNTVKMYGLASQAVASPDGRWLLTLYVNTKTNTAFVHALNLIERIAICINMPPCKRCDREQLASWGLALAPDRRTLFAANPAIGSVATVYLPTAQLIAQNRFTPGAGGEETRAAVAPDGSRLVFTNGRTVWSFDPSAHAVERLRAELEA
jgi:WD40-like Beta Propeller Repeat